MPGTKSEDLYCDSCSATGLMHSYCWVLGVNQMDKREADDPCFYLLAIWSPGIFLGLVPHIRTLDVNELLLEQYYTVIVASYTCSLKFFIHLPLKILVIDKPPAWKLLMDDHRRGP